MILGLLRMDRYVKFFQFCLSDIKNSQGQGSYYPRIYGEDMINVCNAIENILLNNGPFFDAFDEIFDFRNARKSKMFFRKVSGRKINDTIVFINVISWYCEQIKKADTDVIEFSIEKEPFFNILKKFASKEYSILLTSHISLKKIWKYLYRLAGNLYLSGIVCLKSVVNIAKSSYDAADKLPLVSTLYTLRGLNFDFTQRNDFPWLLLSDIEHKRVLVYFDRKDMPFTDAMADMLKRKEIQYMADSRDATTSKNVPVYKPTVKVVKMIASSTAKILLLIIKDILHGRSTSILYLPEVVHFIRTYSEAYDFYLTNGIKVDVDFVDFDPYRVARRLALSNAGGVSISYQLSNWPISNVILGSSADIYFLFGPYYYQKLIDSGTCSESVVISGFLTDYSFSRVKERSDLLRNRLLNNGAEFILCYFDENSSDHRMSMISNGRSELIYKHFLNWVLRDKTIGLICSPKRPQTLAARIPAISDLIQQAQDTGRCVFMDGKYTAQNYPTEVGQAADIVISLLIGGTTSLENFLSGKRVVYLDLEGFYSYPEYHNGKDKIVFSSLDSLFKAIDKYRLDKDEFDDFGNIKLSPSIKDKDPFCDGNSARRMGEYINSLLKGFDQGKSRKNVIIYANEAYSKDWGKEWIIKGVN
jgi:sRNA-binding regulator protein Hfq